MKAPSREQVIHERNVLARSFALGAGTIAVIHLLPKGWAPNNPVRFWYTVAYFAALVYLLYVIIGPRARFMQTLYQWMYEDCPGAIDRMWRRYLYSIDHLITIISYILVAFIGSTGMATLALWYPGIAGLSGIYKLVWWLSLIALAILPFSLGHLLGELRQMRLLLQREVATGFYKPRSFKELVNPIAGDPMKQPPVVVNGERNFTIAGREWHWEDLTKNCIVFGQTGSGKTVCVLNPLIDAIIGCTARSEHACSGLILDPKGDFRQKIRTLCKKHGRERDLLVIDPSNAAESIIWNPLDTDDDELELAARFAAVLEALGMKSEDSSFWVDSAKKFLRHGIALIRLTNPPGHPPSFADLLQLSTSFEAVAERTDRLDITRPACDQCLTFFADEWAELAEETRSSIQAHITNMIDPFLMEPYATVFAGRSTMSVGKMLERGKILYVYMPVADKEAMAKMVGTFVKLEFFRQVLKMPDKKRPSFFLCDEFQLFFTTAQGKGDADFFERNRQSNHVNVIATQNLPALLKTTPRKEPVDNLLGNCLIKIFLRNTDKETNTYASELWGEQLVAMGSGGAAGLSLGKRGAMPGTASGADQYDSVVRPERFTELSIPSRAHNILYAESIVHDAAGGEIERIPKKLKWKVHPI